MSQSNQNIYQWDPMVSTLVKHFRNTTHISQFIGLDVHTIYQGVSLISDEANYFKQVYVPSQGYQRTKNISCFLALLTQFRIIPKDYFLSQLPFSKCIESSLLMVCTKHLQLFGFGSFIFLQECIIRESLMRVLNDSIHTISREAFLKIQLKEYNENIK